MSLEPDSLHFIDLMREFWHFFDRAGGLPLDEKVQLLKNTVIEPNLDCYSYVLGISNEGLRQYIREIEPEINTLSSLQGEAVSRFSDTLGRFKNAFPGFRTDFKIYLLPSLGLFKGMTVPHQGEIILLLGIDGLIGLNDNQFQGYITHELFHAYHFQCIPSVRDGAELAFQTMKMPPLWALLWTEGLASFAVRILYPEIPEEEVLGWRELVDLTKPQLLGLAKEAQRVLKSDSLQDISGFFYFPREDDPNFPTGCGYYMGMLVAGILARKYPIDQLMRMGDPLLIGEMDSALLELQA